MLLFISIYSSFFFFPLNCDSIGMTTQQSNKRPILQVDRLIFDPRYKIKPKLIPSNEIKQQQPSESRVFIPDGKLKIVRLTIEDFNKKKSPIYESVDERLC